MTFVFNTKDLWQLVEHAAAATNHRAAYGQEQPVGPGLLLVKDEGAYLMSNGLPPLPKPDGRDGSLVVYAQGHTPEDGHIGGDDYVEPFALHELAPLMVRQRLIITVNAGTIELEALGRPVRRPNLGGAK